MCMLAHTTQMHAKMSSVKQRSQHGASCMRACVYEVWHCVSLVHTAFCICHNPLSATLRQADNSREDRQPNPLHCKLGRSACKQQVTQTHTHTNTHTHTHTHTQTNKQILPMCTTHTHAHTDTHKHTHINTHTRRRPTHVPLRCTLLTASPGPLQRVVLQLSRTRLSDISSVSLSPPHSGILSLSLSHSLICFSVAGRCHNRCKCVAGSLLSSVFLPFPSLPFSALLSSPSLQLRGRAHSLSHEAGLLSFFKCRVVRERGSERKRKGGRKRRGRSAG